MKKDNKYYISWEDIFSRLSVIDHVDQRVYGVPNGGMIAAGFLRNAIIVHKPKLADVILDDVYDSGETIKSYQEAYPEKSYCFLFDKRNELQGYWLVFPWEADHPNKKFDSSINNNIIRMLEYIGEDVGREGLVDTPRRVVKSWDEIYGGYKLDPKDLLTVFDADGCDEIVLLKDIEFYSTCEHHMLPFYGKAHVAYLPDKKIIGISKLARIVDLYARRLQIQERICKQVTNILMEHLKPKAAACIIEAKHMCMTCRGVGKQNSVMTTSSLAGVFKTSSSAKQELLELIK